MKGQIFPNLSSRIKFIPINIIFCRLLFRRHSRQAAVKNVVEAWKVTCELRVYMGPLICISCHFRSRISEKKGNQYTTQKVYTQIQSSETSSWQDKNKISHVTTPHPPTGARPFSRRLRRVRLAAGNRFEKNSRSLPLEFRRIRSGNMEFLVTFLTVRGYEMKMSRSRE